MKGLIYVVILAVSIGAVCAQDNTNLSVKWNQTKTLDVRIGDQLNVTCEINRNLEFITNHAVEIVIKSAGNEDILHQYTSTFKSIKPPPYTYRVKIDPAPDDGSKVNFIIDNVTDLFDGTLICRVKTKPEKGGKILQQNDLDIVILRPLDALRVKLDEIEPITESKTDAVELDSVYHSVACIAEGSNPAATVTLYLDDKEVKNVTTKSENMKTNLTKFRTTLTASVPIWRSQHKLECIAQTQFGDNSSVQLPVKIKTYKPEIVCNDSQAHEGQKDIVLSCTVDYTYQDVTSFRYSLGSKEYNSEGDHNDEFVEVSREPINDTTVRVHLKLKMVKDWHFQKEFYILVVHRDGHIYRESVRLSEQPSNCVPPCLLCFGLYTIAGIWAILGSSLARCFMLC